MKASELLINPRFEPASDRKMLAELIDKHNLLVRSLFALPDTPVVQCFFEKANAKPNVTMLRHVNQWLMTIGYRCMCVFPKIRQPYSDLYVCDACHKPYRPDYEHD